MNVSVIIVSYNVKSLLCKCIESIFDYTHGVDHEIIVVDNASSDGTVDELRRRFEDIRLIASDINLGFGKANNEGAKVAKGKYLFFLNPDTLLLNNALLALYDFMECHPNAALCGGNLFTADLKPNHSYNMSIPKFRSALEYVFNTSLSRDSQADTFNNTGEPKKVELVVGADMFIRKSVFDQIGRFDERYFMYFEEAILSIKIRGIGMDQYAVPDAHILHFEGASSVHKYTSKFYLDSFLKYYSIYPYYPLLYFLLSLKIGIGVLLWKVFRKQEKLSYWMSLYQVLINK